MSQRSDVTIFTHKRSWSFHVTVVAIKRFCLRKYVTIFANFFLVRKTDKRKRLSVMVKNINYNMYI